MALKDIAWSYRVLDVVLAPSRTQLFAFYLSMMQNDNFQCHAAIKETKRIYGCDICQDVCPWNRFSLVHNEPKFKPNEKLLNFSKSEWNEITEEVFQEIFKRSPVKRTKYAGLKRNINFLNGE